MNTYLLIPLIEFTFCVALLALLMISGRRQVRRGASGGGGCGVSSCTSGSRVVGGYDTTEATGAATRVSAGVQSCDPARYSYTKGFAGSRISTSTGAAAVAKRAASGERPTTKP